MKLPRSTVIQARWMAGDKTMRVDLSMQLNTAEEARALFYLVKDIIIPLMEMGDHGQILGANEIEVEAPNSTEA